MRSFAIFGLISVLGSVGNVFAVPTLINGGFEDPVIGGPVPPHQTFGPDIAAYAEANVPGWETTDVQNAIEIWRSGASSGGPVFNSFEGNQFAEINAYSNGTLSTTVTPVAGSIIGFEFAHRGRGSSSIADVLRVEIFDLGFDGLPGGGNDTLLLSELFSATNVDWNFHGRPLGISSGNALSLNFGAVSTALGNEALGNFIDAVGFGQDIVPEPTTGMLSILACSLVFIRRRAR